MEAAIIGVGLHPFGRFPGKSAMDMAADAVRLALADAGVGWPQVQAGFIGSLEVANPDAIVGRPLFDFMDPEAAFEARTMFARRQRGIAERHEFAFRRTDGSPLHTIVSASTLRDADGAFAGALALVSDVTEQRQAELARQETEARLRLALDVAGMTVWERNLTTDEVRSVELPSNAESAPR